MLTVVPVIGLFAFIFQFFSRRAHRKVRDNVSNMNAFLSIIGIYWAGCLPAITIFSMRRPGEQGHF